MGCGSKMVCKWTYKGVLEFSREQREFLSVINQDVYDGTCSEWILINQFEWYRRSFKLLSHCRQELFCLLSSATKGGIMKKIVCMLLIMLMLVGCSTSEGLNTNSLDSNQVYKIGICNYVEDASLNQIVNNIESELKNLEETYNVKFEVEIENGNGDATIINQIISNFVSRDVDMMVGIATPVALAMQSASEESGIPFIFAAVSDPVGAGLVESLDNPNSITTGTSDYLDTTAVLDMILMLNDTKQIGLLYDASQDSSTKAISDAKAYLDSKGIAYKEYTGTNTSEISLAVSSLISDGIKDVFTPTDNTIMTAELAIYEELASNGVRHFTGADSFALNGAFIGYGTNYIELGKQTADMIGDILVNDKDISSYPVKVFDDGTVTINSETCSMLGLDINEVKNILSKKFDSINEIKTAENFDD